MRKSIVLFLFASLLFISTYSQSNSIVPERLKVFIDCQTRCDMSFIRSEINIVDFLLDQQAADVHVLITDQNTGGGGDEYQLIFFGQNQFQNMKDTIRFINDANATAYEERNLLIKYLKLGLTPYIARTKMAKEIQIQMKSDKPDISTKNNSIVATKDHWNYWVFRMGLNGNMNVDEVYKESQFNGNLSAKRITEEIKLGFELSGGKNKSDFEYTDDNGNITEFTNKNNRYEFSH